ncbi:hypothetical protein KKC94_01530 [Patescibacteria group bacterium]|nr:hypothetical protein [Patescibacteria group bacterium]
MNILEQHQEDAQKSLNDLLNRPLSEQSERIAENIKELLHLFAAQVEGVIQDLDHLKQLLREEVERLKNLDPLIGLHLYLDAQPNSHEIKNTHVGSYKLVKPKMKSLNDDLLGPKRADMFMEEIHALVRTIFPENQVTLSSYFKGGHYVVEIEKDNSEEIEKSMWIYRQRLAQFQETARVILHNHLSASLEETLQGKISEEGFHRKEKIEEYFAAPELTISFGIAQIEKRDGKKLSQTILNAERAANMAALRREAKECTDGEVLRRRVLQEFDLLYLFEELVKLRAELLLEYAKDPETWEGVFEVKGQEILMTGEAVAKYRSGILKLNEEQQAFFERYFKRINIIDVLKNYRESNYEMYSERIKRIVTLCKRAEQAINESNSIEEHRILLVEASEELETSVKDEGENLTGTFRRIVRGLTKPGKKLLVGADHIGFGGTNQQLYEIEVMKLIHFLGIRSFHAWLKFIDVESRKTDSSALRQFVKGQLTSLASEIQITRSMLSPGDKGSEILRDAEKKICKRFGETTILNGDGGDEVQILKHNVSEETYAEDIIKLTQNGLKLRVAGALFDATLEPIPDSDEAAPNTIEAINAISKILEWIDRMHEKIKLAGDEDEYRYAKAIAAK